MTSVRRYTVQLGRFDRESEFTIETLRTIVLDHTHTAKCVIGSIALEATPMGWCVNGGVDIESPQITIWADKFAEGTQVEIWTFLNS